MVFGALLDGGRQALLEGVPGNQALELPQPLLQPPVHEGMRVSHCLTGALSQLAAAIACPLAAAARRLLVGLWVTESDQLLDGDLWSRVICIGAAIDAN